MAGVLPIMESFISAIYAYLAFLFGRSNPPEAPVVVPLNDSNELPHHTVVIPPPSLEDDHPASDSRPRSVYVLCIPWCFHIVRRVFVFIWKCLRVVGGLKRCARIVLYEIVSTGIVRIIALVLTGTVVFKYELFAHPFFLLLFYSFVVELAIYLAFRRFFHNVEYRAARRFENGSVIVISYNRRDGDDAERGAGVWIRRW